MGDLGQLPHCWGTGLWEGTPELCAFSQALEASQGEGTFLKHNVWERPSGRKMAFTQSLGEAESRDSGEVSLLSQVPTPITEMEISVKRVRAAAVAAKSSFL